MTTVHRHDNAATSTMWQNETLEIGTPNLMKNPTWPMEFVSWIGSEPPLSLLNPIANGSGDICQYAMGKYMRSRFCWTDDMIWSTEHISFKYHDTTRTDEVAKVLNQLHARSFRRNINLYIPLITFARSVMTQLKYFLILFTDLPYVT